MPALLLPCSRVYRPFPEPARRGTTNWATFPDDRDAIALSVDAFAPSTRHEFYLVGATLGDLRWVTVSRSLSNLL